MARVGTRIRRFGPEQGGAVAVEFAIVGPMMIVMLLGIMSYGGYFWISHVVQQLANDAARAAMGGLNTTERKSLASASLTSQIGGYGFMEAAAATMDVDVEADSLTVKVAYDASQTPFWLLKGLIPMPSTTIVRNAAVRLGGY